MEDPLPESEEKDSHNDEKGVHFILLTTLFLFAVSITFIIILEFFMIGSK